MYMYRMSSSTPTKDIRKRPESPQLALGIGWQPWRDGMATRDRRYGKAMENGPLMDDKYGIISQW